MNCGEIRDALAAQPEVRTPELERHLAGCEACSAYAAELRAFEARIRRALAVPVPPARALELADEPRGAEVVPLAPRIAVAPRRPAARPAPRWLSMAAGMGGAAILAGLVWIAYPRTALASAVVEHMAEEPDVWQTTESVIPEASLEAVLRRSGVRLKAGAARVSYANSCGFRGHDVPHLVVQTGHGPVTVLVLPEEHSFRATPIDEGGYRGVIVPATRGSLAVLIRAGEDISGPEVDAIAARVASAVEYRD